MNRTLRKPMVLIVRDGWGANPHPEHHQFNAIELAATPCCDGLKKKFPWTLIHTSGEDVGLPAGTMGNSEVGHQNIGAGRIVDQDSVRITKAIRSGQFFENPALCQAVERARQRQGTVHLMGLASDIGVHSLLDHLYGCIELCARMGQQRLAIHCFTDGRDSGPYTGLDYARRIEQRCAELGVGRIASVCGRYYAMDRDNRWDRVEKAYNLLTGRCPQGADPPPAFPSAAQAIQDYYDHPTNASQQGDEFITPRIVGDPAADRILDGDSVIFFNFRGDRPRELTRAFVMDRLLDNVPPSPDTGRRGFDRGPKLDLFFVTFTAYEQDLNNLVSAVAFPKPPKMQNIAGAYLADLGLRQFRCAETEKFPHVTFFFNDYRDPPFPGEDRCIVPSPTVATYDLQPQMSAPQVRDAVLQALDKDYDLMVVNFANGDMVGHTGKPPAIIQAIETVDQCVGAIVDKTLARGGSALVTADHGNAEQMWDPQTNGPHTAHTTYDVELIIADPRLQTGDLTLPRDGRLADIIPTAFALMGLEQPAEMTGRALLPDKVPG